MIDLNNTWCKATEENVDKLLKRKVSFWELGCISNYIGKYRYINIYSKDNKYEARFCKDILGEEIHLVNGEFQYVETKPKNNFKDYGFEAYFEGEIFSQYQDEFYGVVYRETGNNWVVIWSSKSGKCYNNDGYDIKKYNLKPIKKEWYENPDNFPCIIKQINCTDDVILDGDFLILKNINDYHKYGGDYRFPTEKEILKLLVKE